MPQYLPAVIDEHLGYLVIVVVTGIDEIVRQQKAIGRNLNQIATLANMDRLTAVNFQPLLDEHRKVT
ncbi:plasmid mobilization relaxosome protein MobC [Ruminococcus sp.]|uniref:plasmid mobilization relaxosome protein MobC n=1 Tax=Ruminococcus sp. TaxID=41978 RepID=UPI0025E45C45|nr:plasmid mobilization relaxosome protein MobC [Ruminococcus sp.]